MHKRMIAITLSLALTVFSFTACDKQTPEAQTTEAQTTEAAASTTTAAQTTEAAASTTTAARVSSMVSTTVAVSSIFGAVSLAARRRLFTLFAVSVCALCARLFFFVIT